MRVKITQKGVFDEDGKRIEVGKVMEISAKKMPPHLVGKAIDLDAFQAGTQPEEAKKAVTNPAKKA